MRTKTIFVLSVSGLMLSSLFLNGCAVNFYKQSPRSKQKISVLESKIDGLELQRQQEREEFEAMKRSLEDKLRSQIADESVSLTVDERGLVIILSDEILFDSGKAEVRSEAFPVLDEVSSSVLSKVPSKNIGVSGHTDNVPIIHSGWKSNWELSTARSTNVLHYLEDRGISSSKLSATGYGEHRPVASNATSKGRSKNRRVEIVILPEFIATKTDGAIIK